MANNNLRELAIHEAGHVVVADSYFFEIGEVRIHNGSGQTEILWGTNYVAPFRRLCIATAGQVAVDLALGDKWEGFQIGETDLAVAEEALRELSGSETEWPKLQAKAVEECRRILTSRRPLHRRVARALNRAGYLDLSGEQTLDEVLHEVETPDAE